MAPPFTNSHNRINDISSKTAWYCHFMFYVVCPLNKIARSSVSRAQMLTLICFYFTFSYLDKWHPQPPKCSNQCPWVIPSLSITVISLVSSHFWSVLLCLFIHLLVHRLSSSATIKHCEATHPFSPVQHSIPSVHYSEAKEAEIFIIYS